jgi:hypothetical protein
LLQGLANLAEFGAPARVYHFRYALASRNQSRVRVSKVMAAPGSFFLPCLRAYEIR